MLGLSEIGCCVLGLSWFWGKKGPEADLPGSLGACQGITELNPLVDTIFPKERRKRFS
jgi:hypothetical protein